MSPSRLHRRPLVDQARSSSRGDARITGDCCAEKTRFIHLDCHRVGEKRRCASRRQSWQYRSQHGGSFFILGLTKGVERPAIATSLPTLTGEAIMLDVGANVDCTAQHLLQFAIMGNEYGQHLFKKSNPRVGLLSIGEEDSKGNEVTKEAFKLLRSSSLNFIGNVEGRDVYSGNADVVVCDGFIGNVALKISEGVADTIKKLLFKEISGSFWGRLAYPLIAAPLVKLKRRIDYAEF